MTLLVAVAYVLYLSFALGGYNIDNFLLYIIQTFTSHIHTAINFYDLNELFIIQLIKQTTIVHVH